MSGYPLKVFRRLSTSRKSDKFEGKYTEDLIYSDFSEIRDVFFCRATE